MIIKRGSVVSHTLAKEWGIGKVVEVNDLKAVIHFNDGTTRKIISSHFSNLDQADPSLYLPATDLPPVAKAAASAAPKKPRKAKATA